MALNKITFSSFARVFLATLTLAAFQGLVFGPAASAGEIEAEVTSIPVPQELIDGFDGDIETNISAEVSTLQAEDPTDFAAETVDDIDAEEALRYRLGMYTISADTRSCATYDIRVQMTLTAEGPDVGYGDNNIWVLVPNFEDDPLGHVSTDSPSPVGASNEIDESAEDLSAEVLEEGLFLFYGVTTVQRTEPPVSTGYTWSAPTVTIIENTDECPAETTTTTTTTTPSTTTTQPKPTTPKVNTSTPSAGGSVTISDSGYQPGSTVIIKLGDEVIGTTVADDNGNYELTVTLPPGASGPQQIETTGTGSDGLPTTRTVEVDVLGVQETAPRSLAATGSSFALPLSLFGLLTVALGMLFVSRSREHSYWNAS